MLHDDQNIIGFDLWDATGKWIAGERFKDTLPRELEDRTQENFTIGGYRNIYRTNTFGSVRIIESEDSQLFPGTKNATRAANIYLSLIPSIKKIEQGHRQRFDSIISRFAHNLTKLGVRFKSNFSTLISDKARSRPFSEFQDEVRKRIEANTSLAARDVCQIAHRSTDLDAQIEALRVISGYATKPADESLIKVDLAKTLFRLSNPFVPELDKRSISLTIDIPVGAEKVMVDPMLLNAAIWQLLDNASKYVRKGSEIRFSGDTSANPQSLTISMCSVCIDPSEIENVFLEGTKGKHSGRLGEHGIGLFIVRKALQLMGAKIYILNNGHVCFEDDFPYCQQSFVITFQQRRT